MKFQTKAHKKCYEKVKKHGTEIFGKQFIALDDVPVFILPYGSAMVHISISPCGDDDATILTRSYVVRSPRVDAELMSYLLHKNNSMRFGAFGMDSDDDVFFEHCLFGSTCDKEEFKASVLAVATTADLLDDEIVEKWGGEKAMDTVGKGMKRCPKCGTEYPPDARWCEKDGCDLTEPLDSHLAKEEVGTSPVQSDDQARLSAASISRELHGHTAAILSLSFSPDSRYLASGSSDGTVRIWDIPSQQVLMMLGPAERPVEAVSFSPDGRSLASSGDNNTLKLWDVESGTELATLRGHKNEVLSCAFSPDGRRILSAGGFNDNTLKLWNAETGVELATLTGHTQYVNSCAFSPDGSRIVSASRDSTLKLWDADKGAELATLKGHIGSVVSCDFSPDGNKILSAGDDMTLKLWDAESGEELASLCGHTDGVTSCAFSPDGRTILSASWDTTVKLWDVESMTEIASYEGFTKSVNTCAFSPDGRYIASAGADQHIKILEG